MIADSDGLMAQVQDIPVFMYIFQKNENLIYNKKQLIARKLTRVHFMKFFFYNQRKIKNPPCKLGENSKNSLNQFLSAREK